MYSIHTYDMQINNNRDNVCFIYNNYDGLEKKNSRSLERLDEEWAWDMNLK